MAFDDKMPREFGQRRPRQHGISDSANPDAEQHSAEEGTAEALVGRSGEFRLIFKAMLIPGLPEGLEIDGVRIAQTVGPVWTQRTEIRQPPGLRPIFEKKMRRFPIGEGETLTIATIAVELSPDLSPRQMEAWYARALGALGIVAALLDERIAQEQLAEDLIVFNLTGAPETAVDRAMRVRRFPSSTRVTRRGRATLAALGGLDPDASPSTRAAARWYLQGAQEGPTPEAIVSFWIALEALSKPPFGTKLSPQERKLSDVGWVEQAYRGAGFDSGAVEPSIGRLAGLRAEVVHGGVEEPELMRKGYYALEELCRALLREGLGIRGGWPLRPDRPQLNGWMGRLLMRLQQRFEATRWVED